MAVIASIIRRHNLLLVILAILEASRQVYRDADEEKTKWRPIFMPWHKNAGINHNIKTAKCVTHLNFTVVNYWCQFCSWVVTRGYGGRCCRSFGGVCYPHLHGKYVTLTLNTEEACISETSATLPTIARCNNPKTELTANCMSIMGLQEPV
jgi:hypothetical protein